VPTSAQRKVSERSGIHMTKAVWSGVVGLTLLFVFLFSAGLIA
jgi:hypothetical protein